VLTLRLGDSAVLVAPESGGAIAGWTRGPVRLLRMPRPDAVLHGDVHGMACFPLLPYANRIGQGQFDWDGRTYTLRRNLPGHPHSLHGVGWQRSWQIDALTDASIHMRLQYQPSDDGAKDWPFAFDAAQQIVLNEGGLRITLSLTNRHPTAVPAGLGLHPYFPRGTGASLRFDAAGVWLNDPTVMPRTHVAVPAAWDHASGQPIGSIALDNCFTNWPHRATITWDGHGIAIEADTLFHDLQVYTPPGEDFFCAEPVSHRPDAINTLRDHPGDPAGAADMRILACGESMAGSVLFRFI
jgi:aldose 1-epimerase